MAFADGASAASTPPTATAAEGDRIDVNAAGAAELAAALPGIGAVKAAALVAHRDVRTVRSSRWTRSWRCAASVRRRSSGCARC